MTCDEPPSSIAFNSNLRPYSWDTSLAVGEFTQKISTAVGTARTRVTTAEPVDVAKAWPSTQLLQVSDNTIWVVWRVPLCSVSVCTQIRVWNKMRGQMYPEVISKGVCLGAFAPKYVCRKQYVGSKLPQGDNRADYRGQSCGRVTRQGRYLPGPLSRWWPGWWSWVWPPITTRPRCS